MATFEKVKVNVYAPYYSASSSSVITPSAATQNVLFAYGPNKKARVRKLIITNTGSSPVIISLGYFNPAPGVNTFVPVIPALYALASATTTYSIDELPESEFPGSSSGGVIQVATPGQSSAVTSGLTVQAEVVTY